MHLEGAKNAHAWEWPKQFCYASRGRLQDSVVLPLVAHGRHQLDRMGAVLRDAQGQSGETTPLIPLLFDEFEHEMVLLIPCVRLSIERPRPIGTQPGRELAEIRNKELSRLVSVLQNGNAEVVIGGAFIKRNNPAISRQDSKQH